MVDGVESGRQIKEAKTRQLLWSNGIDEMIMDIHQGCFRFSTSTFWLIIGNCVSLARTQKDSFRYFSLKRVRPTPEQRERRMAECKCCTAASF